MIAIYMLPLVLTLTISVAQAIPVAKVDAVTELAEEMLLPLDNAKLAESEVQAKVERMSPAKAYPGLHRYPFAVQQKTAVRYRPKTMATMPSPYYPTRHQQAQVSSLMDALRKINWKKTTDNLKNLRKGDSMWSAFLDVVGPLLNDIVKTASSMTAEEVQLQDYHTAMEGVLKNFITDAFLPNKAYLASAGFDFSSVPALHQTAANLLYGWKDEAEVAGWESFLSPGVEWFHAAGGQASMEASDFFDVLKSIDFKDIVAKLKPTLTPTSGAMLDVVVKFITDLFSQIKVELQSGSRAVYWPVMIGKGSIAADKSYRAKAAFNPIAFLGLVSTGVDIYNSLNRQQAEVEGMSAEAEFDFGDALDIGKTIYDLSRQQAAAEGMSAEAEFDFGDALDIGKAIYDLNRQQAAAEGTLAEAEFDFGDALDIGKMIYDRSRQQAAAESMSAEAEFDFGDALDIGKKIYDLNRQQAAAETWRLPSTTWPRPMLPQATREEALTQALVPSNACLDNLYIMAFTGGDRFAGSDRRHNVTIRTMATTRSITLPDRPGNDYLENKGDLWKLSLDDFKFPPNYMSSCLTKRDIQDIFLVANNNDGWMIDSVVTFVCSTATTPQTCQLASQDLDSFRWIDGNGATKLLKLTLFL